MYQIGKGKPPVGTQFKKGQSGNPDGARKHDELKRVLKKMTSEELKEVITETLLSTEKALRKELSSPDVSVCKLIVGKAMLRAAKEGDYTLMNTLLKRVLG